MLEYKHNFYPEALHGTRKCYIDGSPCIMENARLVFEAKDCDCYEGRDCKALGFYYGLDVSSTNFTNQKMLYLAEKFVERILAEQGSVGGLHVKAR